MEGKQQRSLTSFAGFPVSRVGFPAIAIGLSAIIIGVVALKEDWLSGLVAIAVLVIGLLGSYVLGRDFAGKSPPVRQSFRHLATLHGHLYALTEQVARNRERLGPGNDASTAQARQTLEMVEFFIGQTLGTVGDAMEDWAELAPEEVNELRESILRERRLALQAGRQVELEDEGGLELMDEGEEP